MQLLNEGSNGIVYSKSFNYICKKIKKNGYGMNVIDQYKLQEIALNIVEKNNFKIIRVPKLISCEDNIIIMEKIDDSHPYYGEESNYNKEFCEELVIFYNDFKQYNYIPVDYECFLQTDGTVVILDFDKFINLKGKLMYFGKEVSMQYLLNGVFIPSYIASIVGNK